MNKELMRYYLAKAGKTEQTVAEALGISRKSVNNKINGKTEFTAREIRKIAEYLELGAKEICDIFFSA